jgi:large subunit ribosomal protein L14e
MSLFEVGRLAVKIAGRDAGKTAIVVDNLDETFVLIDGQTRRRKCNIKHLEPLPQVIKIKKCASHEEVKAEFKKMGLEVLDTKPKESKERPRKQRKEKLEEKKEEKKKVKETEKKEKPKEKKEEKSSSFEEAIEKETEKKESIDVDKK